MGLCWLQFPALPLPGQSREDLRRIEDLRLNSQLDQAVGRELQRVGNQSERIRILVRCDRACPGKFVNQLIQRLSRQGIRQVRVAVQSADE